MEPASIWFKIQKRDLLCQYTPCHWQPLPFISQAIATVFLKFAVLAPTCLVSRLCLPYQTLITFDLDSCNCISTGFQSSSMLALKSQIKHLWSGPPPAQNLHLCNHAQRWVFSTGWSQTSARWILKPHHHIPCRLPALQGCASCIWTAQGGLPRQSLTYISNAPD